MMTIAFWDDFFVQKKEQFRRRYFDPVRIEESCLFDEQYNFTYPSLAWSPERNKYLLWSNLNHVFCEIGKQDEHMLLVMHESDDCIHWQKVDNCDADPKFPRHSVFTGKDGSIHGASVMRDDRETDPMQRYKCTASVDGLKQSQHFSPGIIATSPDGIRWDDRDLEYRWGNSMSDAYNSLLWNPVFEAYQVIIRPTVTDRRICTRFSKDLKNWSKLQVMLSPDSFDPDCCEFYGMSAFHHNGIFYGFLWLYDADQNDRVPWKFDGTTYTELVYSYDGLHWNRTRYAMQRHFGQREYGFTDNYIGNMIEGKSGDEWLIGGLYPMVNHGYGLYQERAGTNVLPHAKLNAFYVNTIQPGRFVGFQSVGRGMIRTKKIISRDGDLSLNVAAPYGQVRVQLVDAWHKPVEGFTFEDSIPFSGDSLHMRPTWKKRKLEEVRGKQFALEIEVYSGILYGVSGDFHPFYACMPQKSLGDPEFLLDGFFRADVRKDGLTMDDYASVNLK